MVISRHAFLRGRFSRVDAGEPPIAVDERCLSLAGTVCRVCQEFCDPGAISFRLLGKGRSIPSIDLERCTLCRACAGACPVGTINIAGAAA